MLKDLFDKYKCDKGTSKHHYYKVYEQYFEDVREEPLNFLEIGTFKAASTRAFHEYFPNANIYTIDIFERTDPNHLDILHKDRVHWMKADSMSSTLPQKIRKKWGDVKFDFVIDDGAHWPEANRLTFENIVPFLKDDGTYFIEDLFPMHIMTTEQLNIPWLVGKPDKYDMLKHNRLMTTLDSYNTKLHDRRKYTKKPDTCIMAVTK
jgi:hypothetical protein